MPVSSWTNSFQIVLVEGVRFPNTSHSDVKPAPHTQTQTQTHTPMSKELFGICTAVTENNLWPTVPKREGNTCFTDTWIFYYPMTGPPLSSPGSRGDAASSARRAGCQSPSVCQLSASPPRCCKPPVRRQVKGSEMREHKTGPLQRLLDGASQLGFLNSLSLCSLRATWARCSPSPELPSAPSSATEERLQTEAASCSVLFC